MTTDGLLQKIKKYDPDIRAIQQNVEVPEIARGSKYGNIARAIAECYKEPIVIKCKNYRHAANMATGLKKHFKATGYKLKVLQRNVTDVYVFEEENK